MPNLHDVVKMKGSKVSKGGKVCLKRGCVDQLKMVDWVGVSGSSPSSYRVTPDSTPLAEMKQKTQWALQPIITDAALTDDIFPPLALFIRVFSISFYTWMKLSITSVGIR